METAWPSLATPQQRAATAELMNRLIVRYRGIILRIVLFGSVARGDFTNNSDIDLLIVTDTASPDLDWDISGISARVSLEYDVIIQPHVYSRALWENLRARGRPLPRNVEKEGVELTLPLVPV